MLNRGGLPVSDSPPPLLWWLQRDEFKKLQEALWDVMLIY